ncbi:immunity protein Tsi6 family protein [Advenella mimigardefordensis]|uniref:Tsi6 domain-containing protein n=1 Tax=Advenella mimigardefordensis (strain DSM 17166 / LMG 22922 / DPN7) TaxID=1247726 RepID=W0P9E0_ADVMD|nr:immunity protein Tsi6 family protein [Advenella mimigardefordensis]AHG62107.1 hypothetical protein MIM_c00040 [Advenella mimigardefordensis DPN7]
MEIHIPQTAIEYVDRALIMANRRYEANRSKQELESISSLEVMYDSIVQQLTFVRRILTGEEKDKARLWELTFGTYSAKEFDASDPVFFDRLGDAFFIASQIRQGLKVRLPHEVDPNYETRERELRAKYPQEFKP